MTGETGVNFYGKVATFPKNVKASSAYNTLEDIKVSKKKLWYFIIEKDSEHGEDLQMIKYNNKVGFNCQKFVETLKEFYRKDKDIYPFIDDLIIEGNDKFSVIKNIPNVYIGGNKLIKIITNDLIKLLYK
jgi:hypothetical protein